MINFSPIIERIQALLNEGTDHSITYAALEARMALEKVCYDRLRQRHDYISHAQLKKRQPGGVVRILMEQVDPHVTNTRTLKISKKPHQDGVEPEDDDFVEIGTEVGFNAKKIAKLWQALAKLALHVRLPEHRNDEIPDYGDRAAIKRKVEKEGNDFWLAPEELFVDCIHCLHKNRFHIRDVMSMEKNEIGNFSCDKCGGKNGMRWQLFQARFPQGHEQTDATEG